MKVISGCQTGADEAGVTAAHSLGIPTGGTMPKGWRTQTGPRPDLAEKFKMVESPSSSYKPRTRKNVVDSNVTILFGNMNSAGCALTIKYCEKYNKPYHIVKYDHNNCEDMDVDAIEDGLIEFLFKYRPKTINIAGNRESSNAGIGNFTKKILTVVLEHYNTSGDLMLESLFSK